MTRRAWLMLLLLVVFLLGYALGGIQNTEGTCLKCGRELLPEDRAPICIECAQQELAEADKQIAELSMRLERYNEDEN